MVDFLKLINYVFCFSIMFRNINKNFKVFYGLNKKKFFFYYIDVEIKLFKVDFLY